MLFKMFVMAKRSFYRAVVKGGRPTEDVILTTYFRSKCLPAYGLEACPLRKADSSLFCCQTSVYKYLRQAILTLLIRFYCRIGYRVSVRTSVHCSRTT